MTPQIVQITTAATDSQAEPGPGEVVVDAARGDVRCRHRKAAIVGAGPGRECAPFGDPDWCVWALNEIAQPAFTRHFELHPVTGGVQSSRELRWLERCPTPCYVLDLAEARPTEPPAGVNVTDSARPVSFRGVANAVEYPRRRVEALGFGEYFTCTFAYQIALAILDGFEEIGLWGVRLYLGTARERFAERACVEYWLGVARGRGARVVEDSGLARQPFLYGYDYSRERSYVESEVARLHKQVRLEASLA